MASKPPRKPAKRKAVSASDSAGPRRRANGQLVGGNPGNRGGRGAPPLTYTKWLAHLLDSQKHRDAFAATLADGTHPGFIAATKHASDVAYGRPAQSLTVRGDEAAPLIVRVVHE